MNPKTGHLDLFFDDQWNGQRNIKSYGHDIEASWLLHESAQQLNEQAMLKETNILVQHLAKAAIEGLNADGSMIYESSETTGKVDLQRQWWVQCENVIGHLNLYQHFNNEAAAQIAQRCLDYITTYLIDREHGEWYWSVDEKGHPNRTDDKAGFWKCPYHNSRMCFEILEREL